MSKNRDVPCDPPSSIRAEITGGGLNRMMELPTQALLKYHSLNLLHYRLHNNIKSLTFHFICKIFFKFLSSYFLCTITLQSTQSKLCVYSSSLSFLFSCYNSLLFFPTRHSSVVTLRYVKHQLFLQDLA